MKLKSNTTKLSILALIVIFLNVSDASNETYKNIQWVDLMPEDDIKALYNPPEEIWDIPESGSDEEVADEVFNTLMQAIDEDYQNALSSTKVIPELNETKVKISGFIVPVVIEGDKTTEFFIVPYFGACMHYPPPPPNQTIYAKYMKGYSLEAIYEPFVFLGQLTTSVIENELATAAYHLNINQIDTYDEN